LLFGDVIFRVDHSKKNGMHDPGYNGTNIPQNIKNCWTSDTV